MNSRKNFKNQFFIPTLERWNEINPVETDPVFHSHAGVGDEFFRYILIMLN